MSLPPSACRLSWRRTAELAGSATFVADRQARVWVPLPARSGSSPVWIGRHRGLTYAVERDPAREAWHSGLRPRDGASAGPALVGLLHVRFRRGIYTRR